MKTIVYGPPGCGKSRNAKALAEKFGAWMYFDDWDGESELPDGCLALTNAKPFRIAGYERVMAFAEAMEDLVQAKPGIASSDSSSATRSM